MPFFRNFEYGFCYRLSSTFVILFFLFFLLVGAFFVWKRYNLVLEKNEVNPTRLLDSGRIRPRNVLIISNVDNRHHIDIVLAFSKYLKAHCAVGEVYFALDPHTGITSQADHDPWKWAQVKFIYLRRPSQNQ